MEFDTPSGLAKPEPDDDPGYVPGVQYDGWGRYKLPKPDGDPAITFPHTRVTTIAGVLMNSEGLRIWSERKIVEGIGMAADLRAQIGSDPHSKEVQDEVIEAAKVIAGVHGPSRYGRAFHKAFETWAASPDTYVFQPETEVDLRSAIAKLAEQEITVHKTELLVVHPTMEYAGRLDGIWIKMIDGRAALRIGDEKTGKDLTSPSKRTQCGIQLAGYAHCPLIYDPGTRKFVDAPEIDQEIGYILTAHDGVSELHEIDLVAGWAAFRTAHEGHWRNKAANAVRFVPLGRPSRWEPPQQAMPFIASPPPGPHFTMAPDGSVTQHEPLPKEEQCLSTPNPTQTTPATTAIIAAPITAALDADSAPIATAPATSTETPPEPVKGKRRCGRCRQYGHTSRTCRAADQNEVVGFDADSQPTPGQPVVATAESEVSGVAAAVLAGVHCTCPAPDGWTKALDDPEVWVCGRCGLPSKEATDRVRALHQKQAEFQARIPELAKQAASAVITPAQQLLADIATAPTHEALRGLWQQFGSLWEAPHTAAADARAAQLSS